MGVCSVVWCVIESCLFHVNQNANSRPSGLWKLAAPQLQTCEWQPSFLRSFRSAGERCGLRVKSPVVGRSERAGPHIASGSFHHQGWQSTLSNSIPPSLPLPSSMPWCRRTPEPGCTSGVLIARVIPISRSHDLGPDVPLQRVTNTTSTTLGFARGRFV